MTAFNLANIKKKISGIEQASTEIAEVKHLDERLSEIQAFQEKMKELSSRIDIIHTIQKQNIDAFETKINPDLASFDSVQGLLIEIIKKFTAERTNASLLGTTKWREMIDEAEETCETVTQNLNNEWSKFVSGYLGQSSQEIEKTIVSTPEHIELLSNYENNFEQGMSYIQVFKEDGSIKFNELKTISNALKALREKFDFNIPVYMKEFFEDTAGRLGFNLSKYTPEIQKWLTENDRINSFTIRLKN